jgi:hypothetical protein
MGRQLGILSGEAESKTDYRLEGKMKISEGRRLLRRHPVFNPGIRRTRYRDFKMTTLSVCLQGPEEPPCHSGQR